MLPPSGCPHSARRSIPRTPLSYRPRVWAADPRWIEMRPVLPEVDETHSVSRRGGATEGRCGDRRSTGRLVGPRLPHPRVREGQLDDLTHDGAELLRQRAAVVRDAVPFADLLHLGRNLGIPTGRQVGEQVVLDLVRQVAGQQMKGLAPGQIRRTQDLAEVPHAAGLILGLLDGEFLSAIR